MKPSFIITVDTEGDNLWAYRDGDTITTHNAEFIGRFQQLCDDFDFRPVYLTNYEMACSQRFADEASRWAADGRCEIGLHVHAWNNPPLVQLTGPYSGQAYLIEYPDDMMMQKLVTTRNLITERFGVTPVSHRAGRWAMDHRYFDLLGKTGIRVDCSYTPLISWESSKGITRGGSDYRDAPQNAHMIGPILEVPMTVRTTRLPISGSILHRLRTPLTGHALWMRPALESAYAMRHLADIVKSEPDTDYIEFMIHSSELMPGGSPYNRTAADVECFYARMRDIFRYLASNSYSGRTLSEYADLKIPSLNHCTK